MKAPPKRKALLLRPFLPGLVCVFSFLLYSFSSFGEITVFSDFEGGSVEVLELDHDSCRLKIAPADHPGKGWRCWWYFRVNGLTGFPVLTVDAGDAPWATPDRAHFSSDQGKTWIHSAPGLRNGKRIVYKIPISGDSLLLAWGPPFTPADSDALTQLLADRHSCASKFNLATTREKKTTPALKITAPTGDESIRRVLWIQARQHAWESGSSWVARGLAQFLVSDDPSAATLRETAIVYLIPVMDIDNAARGAGGKNQKPQDHNRDWSEAPHWRAVAAAQKRIAQADREGRFSLFVDLHNPGAGDRFPYFYIPPRSRLSEQGNRNLDRFLNLARQHISGPLKFAGRVSESGPNYDRANWKKISKNWVSEHTGNHVVAVTLETAWNTPASTTANYETVGRQLGLAVAAFVAN